MLLNWLWHTNDRDVLLSKISMFIKISMPIRNLLKATRFWKENYFILREFKHFRRIAILALVFTLLAAAFEGFGVGFILTFYIV